MNGTNAQLVVTQEQLRRAERALESIRRDILPLNEKRYRLMAESYIEQIRQLRAQVDHCLGLEMSESQQHGIVISLEGEHVKLGEVAVGVMTRTLDTFRRGIQALVDHSSRRTGVVQTRGRRKKWIEGLCDLPLVAIEPGSVQIVLGEPEIGDLFQDDDRELLRENLDLVLNGLAWVASDEGEPPPEFADRPETWRFLLGVLRTLVPPRGGIVEAIGFRGLSTKCRDRLRLQQTARIRLNHAIARIAKESEWAEVRGTIREIDLDKNTFALRDRPGESTELRCEYDESTEANVVAFLDRPVVITGTLHVSSKAKQQTMEVESIDADLTIEVDS